MLLQQSRSDKYELNVLQFQCGMAFDIFYTFSKITLFVFFKYEGL